MKNVTERYPRVRVILATALFFVASGFVVAWHGLKIGGVELALSISRHVGLETYSCILFGLANTVVVGLLVHHVNYLFDKHGLPKIWLVLIAAMATALLITSYFPFTIEGAWNSVLHRAASWTMFGMAVLFSLVTLGIMRTRMLAAVSGVLSVYGAICLLWVTRFPDFFWNYVLIIESAFIFLIFLFILSIPVVPATGVEPAHR